jgi:predicted Na+-dependent transporter
MIYILQNLLPILVATLVGLVAGLAVQRLHPGRLGARQRVVAAIAQFWLCCIRVTSRCKSGCTGWFPGQVSRRARAEPVEPGPR